VRVLSVGFFCAEYPISLAGGLARSSNVSLWLSKQDLAVRFPKCPDVEAVLRERGILSPDVSLRLVDYPRGRYLKRIGMAQNLVQAVRTWRPDVVHFQSGGDPWIPSIIPLLRRFPVVVTIHDVIGHTGDWPPRPILYLTNSLLTRVASQIIVHGSQQARALQSVFGTPRCRINIVPHGPYFIFRSLAKRRVAEQPNLVLFFGRMRGYKGLRHLIEAVPMIAQSVPDVRILIAGSGDDPEEYSYIAGNRDRFEVQHGFVPMDAVGELFQRASVVVLPYTDASQSGIVPLAYVFGKPVVATGVGSIPEVVDDGQTGYLVEPRNSEQLALAIVKVLKDADLRRQMGRNALRKVETELTWEGIATKTLEVYARAMEN
jgi:glycosyltransferase involved in cell wall biosynthesis